MTLGSLKNYAVKLIDEFTESIITEDEDIKLKLNDLYNIGQIELACIYKINRVFVFSIKDKENDSKYITIDLPKDFLEESKLRFFSNNDSILKYYIQDKKIKVSNDCVGDFELEYYALPKIIDVKTSDEYELELNIEAQMLLPYYVAADILKSDVSADYTSFEAKYNNKLELLNSIRKNDNGFITINQIIGFL